MNNRQRQTTRPTPIVKASATLLVFGAVVSGAVHASPILETFVMTVAGQSNFPTFSAPAPVYNGFFGPASGNVLGVSVPSNTNGTAAADPSRLAAANIAGSFRQTTAVAGPLSDTMSLNTTFNTMDSRNRP